MHARAIVGDQSRREPICDARAGRCAVRVKRELRKLRLFVGVAHAYRRGTCLCTRRCATGLGVRAPPHACGLCKPGRDGADVVERAHARQAARGRDRVCVAGKRRERIERIAYARGRRLALDSRAQIGERRLFRERQAAAGALVRARRRVKIVQRGR